jgi:CHASE2 domain-containing sensor protein
MNSPSLAAVRRAAPGDLGVMEIMMRFMIIYIEAVLGARGGIIARLREKGALYWTIAAAILVGGFYFQHYLYDALHLAGARAWLFAELFKVDPRPLLPRYGKVVLIGDEEYWKSEKLAGRRPIKRDYLGQLVATLAAADAHVIALDFDMRLPHPDAQKVARDYEDETQKFVDRIADAANGGKIIVLGKTVGVDTRGRYTLDRDIYELNGLCRLGADRKWANPGPASNPVTKQDNIRCGFIELPYDPLVIPERLRLADGGMVKSFALEVALATNPNLATNEKRTEERYGSGISPEVMEDNNVWEWAEEIADPDDPDKRLTEKLAAFRGQTVIIGAGWSSLGFDRGEVVDVHPTVVGSNVGALVHDNFVEALLDSRAFFAVPHWVVTVLELIFAVAAAVLFALFHNLFSQLASLIGLSLLLVIIQWLVLHELGLIFDAFFPVFGLWIHAVSERAIGYHPPLAHARQSGD